MWSLVKKILFVVLALLLVNRNNTYGNNKQQTDGYKEVPFYELVEKSELYFNKYVKVKGVVVSVCEEEGCWVDIVDPENKVSEGILVSYRDTTQKFPKSDIVGRVVVVEGTFYKKIYSKDRVMHWQEHGFRKGREVPLYSEILRIEADKCNILEKKNNLSFIIPPIKAASSSKVDLDYTEFESNRFGIGKKCLRYGEFTPLHSTRNHEEIIYVLNGNLNIELNNKDNISLKKGEMTFIPTNTLHKVINKTKAGQACYLFIYRKVPTTE